MDGNLPKPTGCQQERLTTAPLCGCLNEGRPDLSLAAFRSCATPSRRLGVPRPLSGPKMTILDKTAHSTATLLWRMCCVTVPRINEHCLCEGQSTEVAYTLI